MKKVTKNPLIEKAIEICGGQQTLLAKKIGGTVRQQHVRYWLYMAKIPADRAVQIEIATGGKIKRSELRPDLFCDCLSNKKKRQPSERS